MVDDAAWRCSRCGRFVPADTVEGHHPPKAWCPHCLREQVVHFAPVVGARRDPVRARVEGQEASIFDLPELVEASFFEAVRAVPPGERVSVNRLRSRLDAHEVPAGARGGLFARAVKEGWLEPLFVESGGIRVQAREPSTGTSARTATVRLYRRTERR